MSHSPFRSHSLILFLASSPPSKIEFTVKINVFASIHGAEPDRPSLSTMNVESRIWKIGPSCRFVRVSALLVVALLLSFILFTSTHFGMKALKLHLSWNNAFQITRDHSLPGDLVFW